MIEIQPEQTTCHVSHDARLSSHNSGKRTVLVCDAAQSSRVVIEWVSVGFCQASAPAASQTHLSCMWAKSDPGQVWQHCWLSETSLLAEHLTSSFLFPLVYACSSQCKYCRCLHGWVTVPGCLLGSWI